MLSRLQRIRSTVDEREQKQLLMDLDVVMRSNDTPYIVQFYGALFKEVGAMILLLAYWTVVPYCRPLIKMHHDQVRYLTFSWSISCGIPSPFLSRS